MTKRSTAYGLGALGLAAVCGLLESTWTEAPTVLLLALVLGWLTALVLCMRTAERWWPALSVLGSTLFVVRTIEFLLVALLWGIDGGAP
jgi:hypothetical protein